MYPRLLSKDTVRERLRRLFGHIMHSKTWRRRAVSILKETIGEPAKPLECRGLIATP
jgi:hypothetical protein